MINTLSTCTKPIIMVDNTQLLRRAGRAAAAALSWFDAAKFGWRKSYETMGAAVEQVWSMSRSWVSFHRSFPMPGVHQGNYLWAGKIKAIEGQHGSGVGSYFRFLRCKLLRISSFFFQPIPILLIFFRYLFQLNVVLGLVRCLPTSIKFRIMYFMCTLLLSRSFCFLSVPQILDRFYKDGNRTNTENAYPGNFSFGDIFTGGVII